MQTLNENLLNDITRRLVVEFQPEQVVLFGSYAWGESSAGSDVDLMVIVSQSDLSEYQRAVRGYACLSDLEIAKDVVVKTRSEFDFFRSVRASLEHRIVERGKVLYERSQTFCDCEFERIHDVERLVRLALLYEDRFVEWI